MLTDAEYADRTERFATRPSSRRMLEQLVDMLDLLAHATILDIRCGTGIGMLQIKNRYRMTGLDINPESIRLAKRRFLRVRTYQEFDYSEKYEAVILANVLGHVVDRISLLNFAKRQLHFGGQLGIALPSLAFSRAMYFRNKRSGYRDDPTLNVVLGKRYVKNLLSHAGFVNPRTASCGTKAWGFSDHNLIVARKPWK